MHRLARLLLRLASGLVPSGRREEWLEEWLREVEELERVRNRGRGVHGTPGVLTFAVGAFPHAIWMMKEEWTMDSIALDLRFAGRILRRSPGFTVVGALTLALGIGANAVIFSLVNGLLFRPPSEIQEPERMVQIARSYEDAPRWDNFSWPALQMIGKEARALSGVAGHRGSTFVVGRGAEIEQVAGSYVTGNYFQVLGVSPFLGRLLLPSDDLEPGGHPVVVLSHSFWTRRFGSDPSVVGSTLSIGARPYEVVGVTPSGFTGTEATGTPPALWVPMMQVSDYGGAALFGEWGSSWIDVVGRLADGVSFPEAQASMEIVSARLREADPVNDQILVLLAQGVGLDPQARQEAGQLSFVLFLIVGVVLLLACTNVANLFLARAAARRGEVGVRLALGAGRGRLLRQLLTESLLLASLAIVLALPLVLLGGDFIPLLFPYNLSVSVGADGTVLAFLVAVGLVAGIVFGLAPSWAVSRRNAVEALREGASSSGRSRTRLRDLLVVVQLGLSLALVTGAGLLGRSVLNAASAQPGFRPDGLTAAFINLSPTGRYEDEASGRELWRRVMEAARGIPGVRAVTLANQVPVTGGHSRATVRPLDRPDVDFEAEMVVVGPDYFQVTGTPILQGRSLRGLEDEPERVVVVNEALARMFWPGENAVGKELAGDPGWRVVGVAGDVQMRSLRRPANPGVYYPLSQVYDDFMVLHLLAGPGQRVSGAAIREAVASVDPELPVSSVVDLKAALTASMGETRTVGFLVGAFALLALALAMVGLYGLVAYSASQRVREMGIRMALGAEPQALVHLILVRGLVLSVLGILLGVGTSLALGQALRGLLFGVAPTDLPVLGGAAVLLLLTAGVAAWLPAWRASRMDASVSLREEAWAAGPR